MVSEKAVGIDLGTTNSAVAWVDQSGRTMMVRNLEGDLLTSSVVLFDDAEVVVGKEARNAGIVHPDWVAEWVKRDMGRPVYSRPIRGAYLPPEVIQACILRKLKDDVTSSLGSGVKVVITVPAYFDEPRRKATADAGEMAGLSVLDIVNEPTAAALTFGEIQGYLVAHGKPLEEMVVLVYDLGGGTFDATLLRLAPGNIRTLATDGDVQLGGYDWDMRVVAHVAESFKQFHGVDPRDDPAASSRLYDAVVEAKHTLSARSHAKIQLDYSGRSSQIELGREQFEEMTADLLERTAYTTRQLVAAAGLDWADVSRVLLVGGSTRMPMVSRMLQQVTGIEPDHSVNPDEAVARGAALYAHYLLTKRSDGTREPALEITNVNAHSLGVEGIDQQTLRKINAVLIPRNSPLPARLTEKFVTKTENQRSIVVQVLEGESSLPSECSALGRTVIRDLPAGLPKGWPIEVTFEYGTNGRLNVQAVVPGTDRQVTLDIEREVGLSQEGIAKWKQAVSSSAGFDEFEDMIDEVLRESESEEQGQSGSSTGSATAQARLGGTGVSPVPPSVHRTGSTEAHGSTGKMPVPPSDASTRQGAVGTQPPADLGAQRPAADSQPQATTAEPQAAAHGQFEVPSQTRGPGRLINIIGFILFSIIGLVLGYLLVCWLFPNHGLPRLW